MGRVRKVLKRLIPLLIVLIVGVLATSVAYVHAVRTKRTQYSDDCVTMLERELPRHLVRVERVKAEPFFTEKRTGGDAAAFWNTASEDLDVPHSLQREVMNDWERPSESLRRSLGELDASWIHELRQFGFWSVGSSKLRTSLVSFWARVALLKAYWAGDVVAASADARHVAWLLMTTESLPAFMEGLSILRFERKLHEAALSFEVLDDASATAWFALAAIDTAYSSRALAGIPSVIECTSKSQGLTDASLQHWLRGEPAPTIESTAGCRFDEARRGADEWFRAKRARTAPSTPVTPVELTSIERIGSVFVRHLAPDLGWRLYADLGGPPLCNAGLMKHLDRQTR